jgi:hypothetical protein
MMAAMARTPSADTLPPELFLAPYPDTIRGAAETLRRVVRAAVPEAIERVRSGWALLGYDLPIGRKARYFAFIAPEPIHIHLGFEYGVAMADPEGRLEGAHLKLRKVRFLTFEPGDPIPELACIDLVREAGRVAALTREERLALTLDRDWAPARRA